MCGRFTLRTAPEDLAAVLDVKDLPQILPRFNIAPTQNVLIVRNDPDRPGDRQAVEVRWGLVPYWAEDPSIGGKMFNARAETVAEKPAYRGPFRRRRCLIPADGFYEWTAGAGSRKQPIFFHRRDDRPFAFAGLWDRWKGDDGNGVESVTLITTEPNELVQAVHNRMPVILPEDRFDSWLTDGTDEKRLKALLVPIVPDGWSSRNVSPAVNSARNEGPELLDGPS